MLFLFERKFCISFLLSLSLSKDQLNLGGHLFAYSDNAPVLMFTPFFLKPSPFRTMPYLSSRVLNKEVLLDANQSS